MLNNRLLFLFTICLWCSCQTAGREQEDGPPEDDEEILADSTGEFPNESAPDIGRFGRLRQIPLFPDIYQLQSLDSLTFPIINPTILKALGYQLELLHYNRGIRNFQIGELTFNSYDLEETVEILRSRRHTLPVDLGKLLDAHQIWGQDRRGNVLFTGYYTPIVQVRKTPDEEYLFPIYERPNEWIGPLPTRAEIEGGGALDGLDLEIAFANNKLDIYSMQIQGSGFVEFPDGDQELLSYNGTNRHPFRSIEKYLLSRKDWNISNISPAGIRNFFQENPHLVDSVLFHNPSYTFFKPLHTQPKGAGSVPLTPNLSIAVDRRYIPLGSCLLAAIPIFNKGKTRVIGHEFRLLLAQDVGGRINGPGHVDLYFGTGPENKARASSLKNYGRLWLLLPKQKAPLFSMN